MCPDFWPLLPLGVDGGKCGNRKGALHAYRGVHLFLDSRCLRRPSDAAVTKSPAHGKQSAPVVDELKGGDYNGWRLQGATAYDSG